MTTDYHDTFIGVAPDSPAASAEAPPAGAGAPTVAALQFEMLAGHPYEFTSDDVLFAVHARRSQIRDDDLAEERERFFEKGRPCLRASSLGKRYGWGTHHDDRGRVALVGVGTPEYKRLASDPALAHTAAMRSARAR